MKRKLKIIIPVLVIVIIAAIAAIFVFTSNKIAFTDKSKVSMGLSKTMNSFAISDDIKKEMSDYKYVKNMENNPYEAEIEMSVDANVDNLEDIIPDEKLASIITDALEELSNANLTLKLAMDSKEKKGTMNLNLDAENIIGSISGDAAFTPETVAFRSKDLKEEYLVVNKDDDESEEFQEAFELIESLFDLNYSRFSFTEEEIKYLKDTYGSVFNDFITQDMINSENADFEVDGKSKSCTKEILTIENDKLKELLKKYIETYENDKKGKEIIEGKINSLYGDTLGEQYIESINDMIDSLKDSIDEIEDSKVEFVTYCSLTEVYGTEIVLTIDSSSASIKETFDSDETKIVITVLEQEIANFSIKSDSKSITISGNITIDDIVWDINITISNTQVKFSFSMNEAGESLGKIEISCDLDTKKNKEKEFEQSAVFKVAFDIEDITGDIAINMNQKINIVDKIDFPNLSDAISLVDTKEVNSYLTECQEALLKYIETLQKSEIFSDIMNYSGNLLDTELDKSIEDDISGTEADKVDPKDIEEDITDWVEGLDVASNQTVSEIIEENMITEYDFIDDISLEIYTSWKSGEATNEGFLGLGVSTEDGNSYEYYVDLSDKKVYSEDTAPTAIENIEWNVYE